jgi:hypothetical protein
LRDLALDARNRLAFGDKDSNVSFLGSDVVELQDDDVGLAAVSTQSRRQVVEHVGLRRPPVSPLRLSYLLKMERAARTEVLAKALATPMLTAIAESVEAVEREGLAAFSTLLSPLHEHMFACPPDVWVDPSLAARSSLARQCRSL